MKRRRFLKYLPVGGFFLVKFENALSRTLTGLVAQLTRSTDTVKIYLDGSLKGKLGIWRSNRMSYLSANKLAEVLAYRTYFNDTKKKIVLYLPHNQVVVTASNAFIIIDKDVYQMPAPAIWKNGEIFVPASFFLPLLNRYTSLTLSFDSQKQKLSISQKDINITGVSILEKENGTVIHVKTTRKFKAGEITVDMRYGWLHVDFYGGKTDSTKINQARPAGLVRRIKTFQFPELASLAFYLKKEPLAKEIIPLPEKNEVVVVLRTKEKITEDELADLKEDQEPELSEEMKKQLEEERKKWLIDTIVIDPGHGGKDPGAIGVKKLYEKNVVLPIALKLGKIIKKELPGVKIVFTRKSDRFISLRRRTQIANENNGKVFISIHANWNRKKRVNGFETYILGPEKGERARDVVLKENSVIHFEDASTRKEYEGINQILATMAQNAFSRQSEHLAELVQQELDKQFRSLKIQNRGVKQGPFWVMVGASMPNILVETGFISNPYNAKILRTSAYQYKVAQGIFRGLLRFKSDYENAI